MRHARQQGAEGRQLFRLDQVALAQLQLAQHLVKSIGQGQHLAVPGVDADVLEPAVGDLFHGPFHELQRLHDHLGHDLADDEHHDDQDGNGKNKHLARAAERGLQAFPLRFRDVLGTGDDVLAIFPDSLFNGCYRCNRAGPFGCFLLVQLLVAFHEVFVLYEVCRERGDLPLGRDRGKSHAVRGKQLLRLGHIAQVLIKVGPLLVKEVVLLETPDLEGRVEELGDRLAEHDLLLDELAARSR